MLLAGCVTVIYYPSVAAEVMLGFTAPGDNCSNNGTCEGYEFIASQDSALIHMIGNMHSPCPPNHNCCGLGFEGIPWDSLRVFDPHAQVIRWTTEDSTCTAPQVGGTVERITLDGFEWASIYWVTFRAIDSAGHIAVWSNIAKVHTEDRIRPARVLDLRQILE